MCTLGALKLGLADDPAQRKASCTPPPRRGNTARSSAKNKRAFRLTRCCGAKISNVLVPQSPWARFSAVVLTKHSAKSHGMQLVHLAMLEEPEFVRLAVISDIAHVFGPGMVFADAVSRGYFDIVEQLCVQCHKAT